MDWDVHSPECWAKGLGMARIPLFGAKPPEGLTGTNTVFLDGRTASFTLRAVESVDVLNRESISWAWSSFIRHSLIPWNLSSCNFKTIGSRPPAREPPENPPLSPHAPKPLGVV